MGQDQSHVLARCTVTQPLVDSYSSQVHRTGTYTHSRHLMEPAGCGDSSRALGLSTLVWTSGLVSLVRHRSPLVRLRGSSSPWITTAATRAAPRRVLAHGTVTPPLYSLVFLWRLPVPCAAAAAPKLTSLPSTVCSSNDPPPIL